MAEKSLKQKIEWASENNVGSLTFPIEELEVYARLEDFWNALVEHFGWGGSLEMDGSEFTDDAEERGLIRWEDYDPDKHGSDEWIEAEEGDRIWFSNVGRTND